MTPMPDIQSQPDDRGIPLAKVGVKGLEYPIQVPDKAGKLRPTAAKADLFVNLPHNVRGTHMSRFVEVFHRYRDDLSMPRFLQMLGEIRGELGADSAFGTVEFPFFVEKTAPVSGASGLVAYKCRYNGRVSGQNGISYLFSAAVSVPVSTVCPCSRAISGRGAHNQRGIVTVELEIALPPPPFPPFFWPEDIISLVEDSASSPVYSIIKREDEKYVTERAYDNPRFVEDLVREVYAKLRALAQFPRFSVEAENFESIHNHSACALAEYRE